MITDEGIINHLKNKIKYIVENCPYINGIDQFLPLVNQSFTTADEMICLMFCTDIAKAAGLIPLEYINDTIRAVLVSNDFLPITHKPTQRHLYYKTLIEKKILRGESLNIALTVCGYGLRDVENPTDEQMLCAVAGMPTIIFEIDNPPIELQDFACEISLYKKKTVVILEDKEKQLKELSEVILLKTMSCNDFDIKTYSDSIFIKTKRNSRVAILRNPSTEVKTLYQLLK